MSEGGGDPVDAEILGVVTALSPEQWDAIWSASAEVDDDAERVRWEGGQRRLMTDRNGVEREVTSMPYAEYSPAVDRLRVALAALMVPFAWPDWDGVQRYRDGDGLEDAPVTDAVRLIIAVLRSERFSEGSIAGAIDRGTLPAAVRRLRSWYDAQGYADAATNDGQG